MWGPCEQCIERIHAYEQAGVEGLIIQPIPPLQGMRAFVDEVMSVFA